MLAAILCILTVVCVLVEKEYAHLARKGHLVSRPWVADNELITRENYAKIQNKMDSPVFRSLGYSVPEPTVDRRRILVIGDSFIWGDGLTNLNNTWWRQLHWELERRGYRNVDVVAAGVNGASTQDQYDWLTKGKLLEQIKPDLIVFGYVTNDPQMKDDTGKDLVKHLPPGSGVELQASIFGRLFPNLAFELSNRISKKREHAPSDEAGYPYVQWELKILEGKNFKAYKTLLTQLAKSLKDSAIPAFFVSTPNAPKAERFEARYAPIRAAFKEAGLRFVDLLPPLLECCSNNVGQLIWGANPANGHPGPRMTHFYAKNIADILETEYPQLLGLRMPGKVEYVPRINDWLPASLSPILVAPGEWAVAMPWDSSRMLFMPVEAPHFTLNFERPVSIRSVRLKGGQGNAYRLWATVLDEKGNYELRDYVPLGEGKGGEVAIPLSPSLSSKRITSLRVAVQPGRTGAKEFADLDSPLQTGGQSKNAATPIRIGIDFNDHAVSL